MDQAQQTPSRAYPQALYPGDLIALLWEHKHPRINSLGIESTRFGRVAREDVGLSPHGTFWCSITKPRLTAKGFFVDDGERIFSLTVPCNCIPYAVLSKETPAFNEQTHRFEKGGPARGWRKFLELLAKDGILWPSHDLSYLIGVDSWGVVPRKYWMA